MQLLEKIHKGKIDLIYIDPPYNTGTRTFKALYNPDSNNYNTAEADVTIEVAKAEIDGSTLINPEFAEGLIYNGTAQALVTNSGSIDGGYIVFSLNPDGEYTTEIPVATEAGEYVVFYRIEGDENHYWEGSSAYETVTIAAKDASDATVTLDDTSVQFDGTAKTPGVTSVVVDDKTLNAEGRHIGEIKSEQEGRATVRGLIRRDMDEAIKHCFTYPQFATTFQALGYTLEWRGKYLRIRPDESTRWFRMDKLGEGYTYDDVQRRLKENGIKRSFTPYKTYTKREKPKGLVALYYHYCYLLGALPKEKPNNREAYATIREDVKRARMYSEEAKLLRDLRAKKEPAIRKLQARWRRV